MDLASVRLLLSAEGLSLLDALPRYDEASSLGLGEQLRAAGYDPRLVAIVLTQSRLRDRARAKLGEFADGMVFTPDGLEQMTRLVLAARHAQRFRGAGIRHVTDLGCGLGADALALAGLGLAVTAVDADPVTAALAAHNLRHFPEATVQMARAEDVPLVNLPWMGYWLDPARRRPGDTDAAGRTRRSFSLDAMSPSWSFVQRVAAAVPATGAKLSPGLPHAAVPGDAEAAWTSLDGEVLECALWWGPLVRHPGRTATVLGARSDRVDGGDVEVTEQDLDGTGGLGPVAVALPKPGDYLYEPDRAVIRAGLTGALTARTDGAELSHGVGYVWSKRAVAVPYARRYVVTEAMPLAIKPVRAWLRSQGVGRLTIKKRGVAVDPEVLRRQLKLDGTGDQLTVILTRVGERQAFIVVEAT